MLFDIKTLFFNNQVIYFGGKNKKCVLCVNNKGITCTPASGFPLQPFFTRTSRSKYLTSAFCQQSNLILWPCCYTTFPCQCTLQPGYFFLCVKAKLRKLYGVSAESVSILGLFLRSFLHYKISFDFYYLIFISFYILQIQNKKVILLIWYLNTNTSINWLLKPFSMKHLMCQSRFVAQCRQCDSHKFVWNQWIGCCVVAASLKTKHTIKNFLQWTVGHRFVLFNQYILCQSNPKIFVGRYFFTFGYMKYAGCKTN